MSDFNEMANKLRAMGEPEDSVEFLMSRRPLLDVLGEALRPSIDVPAAKNPPAVNTGD